MRGPRHLLITCIVVAWLTGLRSAPAAPAAFEHTMPPDAGYANVQTDGGAKGDGVTDDTAALKSLLGAGKGTPHPKFGNTREVYFPNGVYLISEPLSVGDKKKTLIGQSRDGVVIRLRDRSPAFQDPRKPAAMISTVNTYEGWHFAQNFGQRLHNLTLDTGVGNPGAVGLDYHTNNLGDVYNLLIRTSDPDRAGVAGLNLGGWTGPGLVHGVTIQGFDFGVRYHGDLHSMTLTGLRLQAQRRAGIEHRGNTLALHDLTSDNAVPALDTAGGHVALQRARLTGGDPASPAILHHRTAILLRDVQTRGYRQALLSRDEGASVPQPGIELHAWPRTFRAFEDQAAPSALPIEAPPFDRLGPLEPWHVVKPDDSGDLTGPLQRAIDAGHPYLLVACRPQGRISDTVRVRGAVRVIRGFGSWYRTQGFNDGDRLTSYKPLAIERVEKKPVFRIEPGQPDTVMLQLMGDNYGDAAWGVEHASPRTLILWGAGGAYRNTVTGGKVFFLDAGPHPGSVLRGPQSAWAWNTNIESYTDDPNILNEGASLWISGLKSEKDRSLIGTTRGGATEVVGGLLFKNRERIGQAPAFTVHDARAILSYRVTRLPYDVHLLETRAGVERRLTQQALGQAVPLVIAGIEAGGEAPSAPGSAR